MSKTLKRFDEESQKWVTISSNDSVIRHYLEDGSTITDKNIKITNTSYRKDEDTDLDDALEEISQDITTLKGNVSWLAEHGGGAQGSTIIIISGSTAETSYGIELFSPEVDSTKTTYISSSSLTVRFKITGGTTADTFQYKYIYDSNDVNPYVSVKGEEYATVTISDIHSVTSGTSHTFRIEALNPKGNTIPSYTFYIMENTLTVSIDTDKNEMSQGGSEILISKSDDAGYVYLNVKNGILNSLTTINIEFSSTNMSFTYTNETTDNNSINFSIWDVIGEDVSVDEVYTITVYAQATLGTSVNNISNKLSFNIRITNPNSLSIYFNGLPYYTDETTVSTLDIENNNRLSYTFKVFTPIDVTNTTIYYAAKLIKPVSGDEVFIIGDSFSDSKYASQHNGIAETNISVQVPMSQYEVGNGYRITMKVWTVNGKKTAEKTGIFNIIEANKEIFGRQYNKRISSASNKDTCLYAWSIDSSKSGSIWTSSVGNYMSCSDRSEKSVTGYMYAMNTNGTDSGFIVEDDVISCLRLQNDAYSYAVMDYSYNDSTKEISFLTNNKITDGFDISITFKADDDPNYKKNVFFWGSNSDDGELKYGIKINLTTVTWYIFNSDSKSYILSGNIRPGKKNTIDFSYNYRNGSDGIASIYVNGIVNASVIVGKLNSDYAFPEIAYFGCDYYNGEEKNFSDINLYEFAVYTKYLNPLQIVVNGKNARINGDISDEDILSDYNDWKTKNLIYKDENDESIAKSYLISSAGTFSFNTSKYNEIVSTTLIPIIRINANKSSLTKETFEKNYSNDKGVTATTFDCIVEFYDPETKKTVSFQALVSLQGTSTLGYLVKNLEIKVNETCTDDSSKYKLFQPKKTWFPEREFTLKADVVDSAHANNATIGRWINENALAYGIMEKNPAMKALTDTYRPKDKVIYDSVETKYTHKDTRTDSTTYGEDIDFDENVSIKFNLEGFPVMLFIQFDNTTEYELIGIYSFNLGRYSYYNMGLSFLKSFSRRKVDTPTEDVSCPAIVDSYEEYSRDETFNGIKLSNIYTYEFGAKADDNDENHMAWSQNGKDILRFYGSFNFNGQNPDVGVSDTSTVWDNLAKLFGQTAEMKIHTPFGAKDKYKVNSSGTGLIPDSGSYSDNDTIYNVFDNYLSVTNAVGYFMVATSFGMIDSLGKNLTLRTWDCNKWYTCFYDMDTALGLSNEGQESISCTAFLDTFANTEKDNSTVLQTTSNSSEGGYNSYKSKLWEIFRDSNFIYATKGTDAVPYYNSLWLNLRSGDGPLSTQDKFVETMESQVSNCGELLYDYDYNSKYILDSQNISMLHGNRIEYVRNWLRKRFYFLDGVFYNKAGESLVYDDSPFYSNTFNVTNNGHLVSIGYIQYKISSVYPLFIMISTGTGDLTDTESRVYIPEYTETIVKTGEHNSVKQTIFTSSSLYTELEGLTGINVKSLNANNDPTENVLSSLVSFDISGSKYLQNDPINCNSLFMDLSTGISNLEELNVSNTAFENEQGEVFKIDLSSFTKVRKIDISNSCVTSLSLPNSILSELNIKYSNIDTFVMNNQIGIKSIDFSGCNKLQTISISNSAIESFYISGNSVLDRIDITNCESLTSVTINSMSSLFKINLNNNSNLKSIYISGCTNTALTVDIVGGSLETIYINGYNGISISLPNVEDCSNVNSITVLKSNNFKGFLFNDYNPTYTNDDMETVTVLDLTPFVYIDYKNIELDSKGIRYIRVSNVKENPNYILSDFFEDIPNVERIFGCIGINDKVKFNYLSKFYINHDTARYSKIVDSVEFVDDKEYTNVILDDEITSLDKCFYGTSVDYSDMYYIMSLNNMDKVNNISSIFGGCSEIELEEIDVNLFKNCTNVNNIVGSFGGCNISCCLPNGLLDPITNKSNVTTVRYKVKGVDTYVIKDEYTGSEEDILEEYKGIYDFSNVFTSSSVTISDEGNFFNDTDIETISNFNPQGFDENGDGYYEFHSNTLLNGLEKLKYLTNSFNKCGIDFTDQELFSNTPELINIYKCFSGITITESYQKISSNGSPLFKDCNKLETIYNSFIFTTASTPYMEITDDFFSACSSTLKSITNNTTTSYDTDTNVTSKGCFVNVRKYYLSGTGFPYNVFKGCSNLKEIPGFLNGLVCLSEEPNTDDGESPTTDTGIVLPGNMLEDCVSLENFSYGFSNLSGITYTLSSDGFAKCNSITNIDGIFSQNDLSETVAYTSGFSGRVPYHMFYNPNNTISTMESCFSGCRNTSVIPYTATDDEINTYGIENGVWNEYIYDGSSDFFYRFSASTIYTEHTDMQDSVPDKFKEYYGITPVEPSESIIGLVNLSDETMTTWLNTVFNKTNYFCPPDIFKYCQTDASINGAFSNASIINERKNKMGGFRGRIPNILFKPLTDVSAISDVFSSFQVIIPEKWGSVASSASEDERKGNMYPVDLFSGHTLYTLSNIFGNTYIWGNTYVSKSLLDEVSSTVANISGFWSSSTFIIADESNKNNVYQIPEDMFDNCVNLTNISSIFSNANIHISSKHFNNCIKLTNVSSFMSNADEAYGQVPDLWSTTLHPSVVNYRRAFYNIDDVNITNYSSIPSGWIDSDD